jgi:hypothetical protein
VGHTPHRERKQFAGSTGVLPISLDFKLQPASKKAAIRNFSRRTDRAPTRYWARMEQAAKEKKLELNGFTIAQFLGRSGRYDHATCRYQLSKVTADDPVDTVIVDEASMLTEEMLGALLDCLKPAKRIILVGDPRQSEHMAIAWRCGRDPLSGNWVHSSPAPASVPRRSLSYSRLTRKPVERTRMTCRRGVPTRRHAKLYECWRCAGLLPKMRRCVGRVSDRRA